MKREFTVTYATYVLSMCMGYFMPAWLAKISGDTLTKPMTLAFSNIPGITKRIRFRDVETIGQTTTFICAGRIAISICLMSYCENITYAVNIDSCVEEDPKEIVKRFDAAINSYIALG